MISIRYFLCYYFISIGWDIGFQYISHVIKFVKTLSTKENPKMVFLQLNFLVITFYTLGKYAFLLYIGQTCDFGVQMVLTCKRSHKMLYIFFKLHLSIFGLSVLLGVLLWYETTTFTQLQNLNFIIILGLNLRILLVEHGSV